MLKISGNIIEESALPGLFPDVGEIGTKILGILVSGRETHEYSSTEELKFEIDLRNSIIRASVLLSRSGLGFATFRDSRCNEEYWIRTNEGGFSLKPGVRPAAAVENIFVNGRKYATECSTAIVIVYLKAVADVIPEELFNELFPDTYLMNWQNLDSDLGIRTYRDPKAYLPGDCRYFKNPDVDPLTPEWQGENAIDLGNGTYYGHGMGITTSQRIILALNSRRKAGSETSAYLMDTATNPGFKALFGQYQAFSSGRWRWASA